MKEKMLEEGIRYLVDELRIISGISLGFGNETQSQTHIYGNGREVQMDNDAFMPIIEPLTKESIFDLASVTKLFTCISLMQLIERGKLSLSDKVQHYVPRFKNLAGITVYDLLAFQTALATDARVDVQSSREAALKALFSARPVPRPERRFYTDMGAMVLKYVIEAASDLPFESYLKKYICMPLDMMTTFASVPEEMLKRTVCYNYERRIIHGAFWLDTRCEKGKVHDPKARILQSDTDLCGHAGLFSTLGDMTRLAQGLLNNVLLKRETLLEIDKNRTGRPLAAGEYTQYLGYLCFCKHPDQTYSEVPRYFGKQTIALNGFCGNHFSVDPEQNRYLVLLSNRIHNRVTMVTGRANPHEKHIKTLVWDDEKQYTVSQNYVYYKDENIKDPIGRLFAQNYGFLSKQ